MVRRGERGDQHSGPGHHGSDHPLQPSVHPAARARLQAERLHPRQHCHPDLQPTAGPAAGPASSTGPRPTARAAQGRPDARQQEEVYQEGEEVEG